MAIKPDYRKEILRYLQLVKADVISQYDALGFRVTGRTIANTRITELKRTAGKLTFDKNLGTLITRQEGGGLPPSGQGKPIGPLLRWFRARGLEPYPGQTAAQAAYAIGRKMAQEGNRVYRGIRRGISLDDAQQVGLNRLTQEVGKKTVDAIVKELNKAVKTPII